MSLIRYSSPRLSSWSPFAGLSNWEDEVNRFFNAAFTDPATAGWAPALDLYDQDEHYTVTLEVPGLAKENLHLSYHEGVLTVTGERPQPVTPEDGKTFRSERVFGKFQRSVTLPGQVDADRISAGYKDGILTVTLPKAEAAKPRQIQVNAD